MLKAVKAENIVTSISNKYGLLNRGRNHLTSPSFAVVYEKQDKEEAKGEANNGVQQNDHGDSHSPLWNSSTHWEGLNFTSIVLKSTVLEVCVFLFLKIDVDRIVDNTSRTAKLRRTG